MKPRSIRRLCPECGHQFRGIGFHGIDAHWRAKHEHLMPYKEAWPLIRADAYPKPKGSINASSGSLAHKDKTKFTEAEINEIMAKCLAGEFEEIEKG
jgi:hypothetical protein